MVHGTDSFARFSRFLSMAHGRSTTLRCTLSHGKDGLSSISMLVAHFQLVFYVDVAV